MTDNTGRARCAVMPDWRRLSCQALSLDNPESWITEPRFQRPFSRRPSASNTSAVAIARAPVDMLRRVTLQAMTYSATSLPSYTSIPAASAHGGGHRLLTHC
jgi:hypothetical protein